MTKRNSLIIAAITSVILCFQNCSNDVRYASITQNNPLISVSENNGGSYEGKPDGTYYRFIPGNTCEQQEAPYAYITIFSQSYFLTRNTAQMCDANTESINALAIDSSVFQKEVIGYQEGIYEVKMVKPVMTPAKIVEFWCRSTEDITGVETIAYYDSLTRKSTNKLFFADQNADGSYTQRMIPEFEVNTITLGPKVSVQNQSLQYEQLVHRDFPSLTEPGQFEGRVEFNRNGQVVQIPTTCRTGGRYDPAID